MIFQTVVEVAKTKKGRIYIIFSFQEVGAAESLRVIFFLISRVHEAIKRENLGYYLDCSFCDVKEFPEAAWAN